MTLIKSYIKKSKQWFSEIFGLSLDIFNYKGSLGEIKMAEFDHLKEVKSPRSSDRISF